MPEPLTLATHPLPMVAGIYLLCNRINGKQYVGQARNIRTRWYWHRNAACGTPDSSYEQKTAIARAMRKHGIENFDLFILEYCQADLLNDREVFWIAHYECLAPNGYNLTSGGTPARRAAEVGARISAANKGRVKTPEWRAKLSAAHKGKTISVEQRRMISERQCGRKASPETRAKMSAALKGRKVGPYSKERCAAISAGMSHEGHRRSVTASLTPEAIEKRAAQLRGKRRPHHVIEKMREGGRRQWQTKSKEERRAFMLTISKQRKSWVPSEETKRKISMTLKARNAALRPPMEVPFGQY